MTDPERVQEALVIARRALAYYASEDSWCEDDWGVRAILWGKGYGKPEQCAANALRRIERLVP